MSNQPKLYSTKLTPEQNAALARYEQVCGMEPIELEAFETGEISAYQLWQVNLGWLESVLWDVQNIDFPVPLEEALADYQ
ncbi:hypothetical protein [Pseudomonas viridiflava]|uniref:hypothetical protein n=1 Tax=Pseudomonas viridiflava TaxID=33069 RepID=UPI000F022477|nr:hypothetical protein [Pseudomonas viridiflava]